MYREMELQQCPEDIKAGVQALSESQADLTDISCVKTECSVLENEGALMDFQSKGTLSGKVNSFVWSH